MTPDTSIAPAFQELSFSTQGVNAAISTTSAILTYLSSAAGTINATELFGTLAGFAGTANSLISIAASGPPSDLSEINKLAAAISTVDTSSTQAGLTTLETQLSNTNGKLSSPITIPSDDIFSAVAVSEKARNTVSTELGLAQQELASLDPLYRSVDPTITNLQAFRANVISNLTVVRKLEGALSNIDVSPAIDAALADAYATEANLNSLVSRADSALSKLGTMKSDIVQTAGNLNDLVDTLDSALAVQPLQAHWATAAYGTLSTDAYILDFSGRSFDSQFTELDGPFSLGTLFLTNLVSYGDSAFHDVITFEAQRDAVDPVLGLQSTVGYVSLDMYYFATPNVPDDPNASADYFSVPALGIDVNIYEGETFAVSVLGQYDSPLRIVGLEPVAGNTGGFITASTPEVGSGPLTFTGGILVAALVLRRRALRP